MDTSTRFEINPFVGTSIVQFGMSPIQVESLISTPDQVIKNHLKQRVEFRSFMNVAYSHDLSELCHIGFGRQMANIMLDDINFFIDEPSLVIERLANRDNEPMVYLGFIVFSELGIALTGFHDQDISQKALTLFEKGAWDKRKDRMKPFHIN